MLEVKCTDLLVRLITSISLSVRDPLVFDATFQSPQTANSTYVCFTQVDDKLELRVRVALPVIRTWSNYLFRKLFREMATLKRGVFAALL